MGPRIILCDAIPIDSNIGGSGHRPLLLRGSVAWLLLVVFLPWVVRVLVVSLVLKVSLQRPLFRVLETCIFLSPRYYRGLPQYYRFERHGTTAPERGTTAQVRYFRRAVLPR